MLLVVVTFDYNVDNFLNDWSESEGELEQEINKIFSSCKHIEIFGAKVNVLVLYENGESLLRSKQVTTLYLFCSNS